LKASPLKVRGKWTYLYRALDNPGNTIDFYLSPTRNAKAAKRFLGKAMNGLKDWERPALSNTAGRAQAICRQPRRLAGAIKSWDARISIERRFRARSVTGTSTG
jgi:transposase-like protein